MSSFYCNVQTFGNKILYRGIIDDKRVKQKIDYSPSLFLPSSNKSDFTSLNGDYLTKKTFESINDARQYIKTFDDVHNSKIYGNNRFEYAFIAEQHKEAVEWNKDKILTAVIDIEVGSENGFPNPYLANEPITAICIKYINGSTFVFGCGDYEIQGKEIYVKCKDEWTLCNKFLRMWYEHCPDIVTGWNTKFFDIPYLVNRFRKILGEENTKKLSPWNYIGERKTNIQGRELIAYDLMGISSLDYIELYKGFAKSGKSQESYTLNNIANIEVGESKISYEEYDNLFTLLSSSDGVTVDKNKPIENMKPFERWCLLKDNIKEELQSRTQI